MHFILPYDFVQRNWNQFTVTYLFTYEFVLRNYLTKKSVLYAFQTLFFELSQGSLRRMSTYE